MFVVEIVLPVFPPRTDSATPAPLGRAMSTPTHRRLTSPRDLICVVGKLVELPHFVSKNVVNNLEEWKECIRSSSNKSKRIYPSINPQLMHSIKPINSL